MFRPQRFQNNAARLLTLPLLLSLVLLTSCGARQAPELVTLRPPDLSCAASPRPPEPAGVDSSGSAIYGPSAVGTFIAELKYNGDECRAAVAGYRAWASGLGED